MKRVAASVAEAYRCTADVEYNRGVPPFICEDEWVDRALRVGKKMLGEENTKIMPYAAMGGEDFAFIKEKKPGIFVRLGARTRAARMALPIRPPSTAIMPASRSVC